MTNQPQPPAPQAGDSIEQIVNDLATFLIRLTDDGKHPEISVNDLWDEDRAKVNKAIQEIAAAVQAAQVGLLSRLLEQKFPIAHWAQGVDISTGGGLVGVPYAVSAKTIEEELALLDQERKEGRKKR